MKRTKLLMALMLALMITMSGCGMEYKETVRASLSEDDSRVSEIRAEIQVGQEEHSVTAEPLIQADGDKREFIHEDSGRDGGEGTVTDTPADLQLQTEPVSTYETEIQKDPDIPAMNETAEEHRHQWVDEIVAHHDAVTHVEHHEAVTEDRWVSVTEEVNHFYCDVCLVEFSTQAEAYAHEDATMEAAIQANDMSLAHSGHSLITETVDNGYWETVTVQEAYDETVTDEPAWDEHIFVCSSCGEKRG